MYPPSWGQRPKPFFLHLLTTTYLAIAIKIKTLKLKSYIEQNAPTSKDKVW